MAYKPITELAHLIRTRHLSPVELTDLYLERIGQYNGALKSYITVVPERARREAHEAARALKQGADVGPLHGIPLAYKDEFYTKGVRTTCGSVILSAFVPDYDATTVSELHEAGAVMLGKLNMTEWATPHSTLLVGKGYHCSAKPLRGEDLDIEEQSGRLGLHRPTFHFHPTLRGMLRIDADTGPGSAEVGRSCEKRLLTAPWVMKTLTMAKTHRSMVLSSRLI